MNEEDKALFDKHATEQEYISHYPEITIPVEIPADIDNDFIWFIIQDFIISVLLWPHSCSLLLSDQKETIWEL